MLLSLIILSLALASPANCEADYQECIDDAMAEAERCAGRCEDAYQACEDAAAEHCSELCEATPPGQPCFDGCYQQRRNACSHTRSGCVQGCQISEAQERMFCYLDACLEEGP